MECILELDKQILLFIQEYIRMPILNEIMKVITLLGNAGFIWILFALILLCTKKYRKSGAMIVIALVFGVIVTNILLKNAFARIRPYEVIDGLNLMIKKADDWSFPSGHSTSSMAASWVMFKTLPKKFGIPALVLGILLCFSRLYVGIHYPTDVLVGAMIGIVSAIVAMKLVEKRIQCKE